MGQVFGGIAGGLMSGIGGYFQGEAANDAGAKTKQTTEMYAYAQMIRNAYALLGADEGDKWVDGNVPKEFQDRIFGSPDFQQQVLPYSPPGSNPNRYGRGSNFNVQADNMAKSQGTSANDPKSKMYRTVKGFAGELNRDALRKSAGRGAVGQMSDLSDDLVNQGRGIKSQYDADTGRLSGIGDDIVKANEQWGAGEEDRIRRDMGRAEKGAQQGTLGDLISAGLGGSSVLANARSANARRFGEATSDQVDKLKSAQIERQTALRQSNLSLLGQRLGGGTNLSAGLMTEEKNLRSTPISMRLSGLQSGLMNPLTNTNPSQFYPGYSPAGMMLSSFGNSLSGMGGSGAFGGGGGGGGGGAGGGMGGIRETGMMGAGGLY